MKERLFYGLAGAALGCWIGVGFGFREQVWPAFWLSLAAWAMLIWDEGER